MQCYINRLSYMASEMQKKLTIRSRTDIKNNKVPEKMQFSTPASLLCKDFILKNNLNCNGLRSRDIRLGHVD